MPKERDNSPSMASNPPPQDHEARRKPTTTAFELETAVLEDLKISSYDLAALKKFLIAQELFPRLSNQQSIDTKALEFRDSYCVDPLTFAHNPRLDTLFGLRVDDFEVFLRDSLDIDADTYERREIQRETAKFNALRSVVADVAACQRQLRLEKGKEAKGKAGRAWVHRVFVAGAMLGCFFFLIVVAALLDGLFVFVSS